MGVGVYPDLRLVKILVKLRRKLGEQDFEYLYNILYTKKYEVGPEGLAQVMASFSEARITPIIKRPAMSRRRNTSLLTPVELARQKDKLLKLLVEVAKTTKRKKHK